MRFTQVSNSRGADRFGTVLRSGVYGYRDRRSATNGDKTYC